MVDAGIAACSTTTAVTISPRLNGFKTNINIIGIMTILTAVNTNSHTRLYMCLKSTSASVPPIKNIDKYVVVLPIPVITSPNIPLNFSPNAIITNATTNAIVPGFTRFFILPINDFSFSSIDFI